MTDHNPAESLDAEGIPEVDEQPPGIGTETEHEGLFPPRDEPLAAGGDPAYPVTAAEDRVVEGVAQRAEREEPDTGAAELGAGAGASGSRPAGAPRRAGGTGQLIEDPGDGDEPGQRPRLVAGRPDDDEAAPSGEEAAMEVLDDDRF